VIKLTKASKMPCKSFALQAMETCPGALDVQGEVKPVCQSCYAMKGTYVYPVVKASRASNLEETKKDSFVPDMVDLLYKQKGNYFRWFDSGDIYSNKMLYKVYSICRQTPHIKHWIPTKSRELFNQVKWECLEALPNVKVRYSSDSIEGNYGPSHGSTVVQKTDHRTKDRFKLTSSKEVYLCPSSNQDGKCGSCRACWSKKIKVIAYVKH
jgi:hypothetical protein